MHETVPLSDMSQRELAALRSAALWYAKYRAADISDRVGERSAAAVVEREEYLDLVAALRKLGVRVRVPDGLADLVPNAA